MITTCTPSRACVRHLARGVAGPSEGDPCGELTIEDVTVARDVAQACESGPEDYSERVAWALAEQLLAVTERAERAVACVRTKDVDLDILWGKLQDAEQEHAALRAKVVAVVEAARARRGGYGTMRDIEAAALALLDDAPAAPARPHGATCRCGPEDADCAGEG